MDARGAARPRGIGRRLLRFVLWWIGVPAIAVLPFWASGLAAPCPGAPRVDLLGDIGPAGLLAGTAAAIGVLLVAVLAARLLARQTAPRSVAWQRARIRREEADRAGTPRYADPDAPGRSRPRAPCAAHAVA
jgi:hypothetical protein